MCVCVYLTWHNIQEDFDLVIHNGRLGIVSDCSVGIAALLCTLNMWLLWFPLTDMQIQVTCIRSMNCDNIHNFA